MTTINVTDATLKGDVAGPTFTGKVDGSKFSGSVTYTETATTPPPTENTGPTGGLITAFQNKPNFDIVIDGLPYEAAIADKPYALKKIDDYTIRHEIRTGDNCSFISDSSGVNRSFLNGDTERGWIAENTVFSYAYRIMVEAGGPNTAEWFVTTEIAQYDPNVPSSPPIAIEMLGDKWSVVHRTCPPGGNPSNSPDSDMKQSRPYTGRDPIVRGQWYVFEIEAKSNQSSGYLKVKLDGTQIVDYSGALGYGIRGYLMSGLYRQANDTTFAVQIKNMTVSWA